MHSARRKDELTREPSLDEALADPVVQAMMARDRVSRDDVLRVARAAQARMRAVVTPFPARAVSASAHPAEYEFASVRLGDDGYRPVRRRRGGRE